MAARGVMPLIVLTVTLPSLSSVDSRGTDLQGLKHPFAAGGGKPHFDHAVAWADFGEVQIKHSVQAAGPGGHVQRLHRGLAIQRDRHGTSLRIRLRPPLGELQTRAMRSRHNRDVDPELGE